MDHQSILLILAILFGFFMAWGVGANDVANAMGTSVGSKALTLKQVVIIAAIFEFAGAVLAGGEVTNTIRGEIIDVQSLAHSPELLVYGMLASLLSAGFWLLIASNRGWVVSTTHTITGAIIGFGVVEVGVQAIHWSKVTEIALSWIVTPILSGAVAFFIFISVQKLILSDAEPLAKAKRYVPWYAFLVTLVITVVTLFKGLQHLNMQLSTTKSVILAFLLSAISALVAHIMLHKITLAEDASRRKQFAKVEKVFGILMIFTACAMAFAHGSNDVANAVGPLAAIVDIINNGGDVNHVSPVPGWVLSLGAFGILLGLATYGYRIIETIGSGITSLTPSRGFAAQLATATTVVLASGTGLPISTTQTLVGAILGVGMARGIAALNLHVIRGIFMSWVVTLPVGAGLAVIFFYLLKWIFG